jgi:hypothetical protein
MKVLLLSALMLTSCGSIEPIDWYEENFSKEYPPLKKEEPIDSLKLILDSFLYDCGTIYKADISSISKLEFIRYGETASPDQPNTVGLCTTYPYNNGTLYKSNIVVKQNDSAIALKAIVYHELGHCILGLEHTSQESETLMSPIMMSDDYYENNWDVLVKNMCNKFN